PRVEARLDAALHALVQVVRDQRRAERAAGVARGRLQPEAVVILPPQELAVGDAVERHAAGEAEVAPAGFPGDRLRELLHHLLGGHLDLRGAYLSPRDEG